MQQWFAHLLCAVLYDLLATSKLEHFVHLDEFIWLIVLDKFDKQKLLIFAVYNSVVLLLLGLPS